MFLKYYNYYFLYKTRKRFNCYKALLFLLEFLEACAQVVEAHTLVYTSAAAATVVVVVPVIVVGQRIGHAWQIQFALARRSWVFCFDWARQWWTGYSRVVEADVGHLLSAWIKRSQWFGNHRLTRQQHENKRF